MSPPTSPPPEPETPPAAADVTRAGFVLLALLPALVGIFGIGNVVIGRIGRGVAQLILSVFTVSGCLLGWIAMPCACVGLPLYFALLAWTAVDALMTDRDARGRPLR